MTLHRGGAAALLLSALSCLAALAAPALGQVQLATQPGLNPAQAQVAAAIDTICVKLRPVNAAQEDLLARCSDMKAGRLGLSVLPDVLRKVSPEDVTVQGTGVVETRSPQLRPIGTRLASLRTGAAGVSVASVPDADAKSLSAGAFTLGGWGGGASADRGAASPLGAFINGAGSFGSKDETSREAGLDFHTAGLTAGIDYRLTDNFILGAAFNYSRTDADVTVTLGEVDSRSYGVGLYSTYYVGPFYLDLLGGFNRYNYDTSRRIVYSPGPDTVGTPGTAVNRTATGDTDGWEYTFAAGVGYNFRLGGSTLTPYVRVDFLHQDIDGYTEHGAEGLDLRIKTQHVESLLTVLGGSVAHAFSTPFAILVPHLRGEWRHEALNGQRAIRAQFANDPFNVVFSAPTDEPDRDYFALAAGVSSAFRKGVAAFFDYETVLGFRGVTNHSFTAGVRLEF